LEYPDNGQAGWGVEGYDPAGLVGARPETPFGEEVQAVQRPRFEEKLIDVVGLYLNPPDQAIVLCIDKKSSMQACDR
jgi:hypothetical protein